MILYNYFEKIACKAYCREVIPEGGAYVNQQRTDRNSELTAILRENGFKVTPQRLAVYETLAATHEHPSAEMLYKTLRPKYPSMSFATVYKTVEILNRLHVIQILNTGEDSFRYDADISEHHHVQCTCCGKVEDLFNVDDSGIMAQAEKQSGYKLSGHQFYFYGICEDCRKKH